MGHASPAVQRQDGLAFRVIARQKKGATIGGARKVSSFTRLAVGINLRIDTVRAHSLFSRRGDVFRTALFEQVLGARHVV